MNFVVPLLLLANANLTHLTLMIYTDVSILHEYHENVGCWVWWWSAGVNMHKNLSLTCKIRQQASLWL
jgi:hypothetical protein